MSSVSGTSSTSTSGLSSYFQTIIDSTIASEKAKKLDVLEAKKTTLESKKSMYTKLTSMFSNLQKLTQSLISKDGSYAVKPGNEATIDGYGSEDSVVTASLTNSSVAGDYKVIVSRMATSHQVTGTKQVSASTALGLTGDFYIGGRTADQGALATTTSSNANVINSISTVGDTSVSGAIDTGKKQLGDGQYNVETRQNTDGTWQFRLVDTDSGKSVSVRDGTDTTASTSDWQDISAGEFDTGRGMKITFADPSTYTAADAGVAGTVTYAAQGEKVTVESTDSLNNIASKINSVSYADGNKIIGSVVDGRLVLTSKNTGRAMTASEEVGNTVLQTLGILTGTQNPDLSYSTFNSANEITAKTAQFSVNGISMERRSNTNLTNVVSGMTLGFSGVTQGDTVSVTENMDSAKASVESFLTSMNEALLFIEENSGTTKIAENQYVRGGLADDSIFSSLRSSIFSIIGGEMGSTYQRKSTPTGGTGDLVTLGDYNSLRDIGITIDDNLSVSITDEDKLVDAMTNHLEDVQSLFDAVMGSVDDELGRFTGSWGDYGSTTTGYLWSQTNSNNNEINNVADNITDEEERLSTREAALVQQYAMMQSQLLQLQYMQQTWSAIYGSSSS